MHRIVLGLAAALVFWSANAASARAQILPPSADSSGTRVATLQEVLVNNLRATTLEQQEFLRRVDRATSEGKLQPRLVLAVLRYAQRRNPPYPFPYFERAIRHEASKRRVHLPPVAVVASTATPYRRR